MSLIDSLLAAVSAHPTMFGIGLGVLVVLALHFGVIFIADRADSRASRRRGFVTIDGGLG